MAATTHTQSQNMTWSQQQDQKWKTITTNKLEQLDSLFDDHLQWFRQHKTASSLIATRRAFMNDDTTDIGQAQHSRLDDRTQNQSSPQQNDSECETQLEQNNTIVNMTTTKDSHPSASPSITNEVISGSMEPESTEPPPPPPPPPMKISREYLLRHFEQEEQKYGRYGLRNRSLGSSLAATSSSKQSSSPADIPTEQRRQTIAYIGGTTPTETHTTKESEATIDNTPPPASTIPTDVHPTPDQQSNTPTPKDQRQYTYSQEEQFDDQVVLVSRPHHSNNSPTALNDESSRSGRHSGLGGTNNSLMAGERYSFSSLFSFNRASSSALEPSVHDEDMDVSNISNISNGSNSNKLYTPKRAADHTRTSRLTYPSPSTSSKKRTLDRMSSPSGPATKVRGHKNSSSTTSRHQSYTPGKPWNATPVSNSFLSSSTVYTNTSFKGDSSRRLDNHQPSSPQKSSKENGEMEQHQKSIEESDQANESQKVADTTTDNSSQPTTVLIPSWATHPELDQLLREQIKLDADKIFGKMPPLQVSQIVKMNGY